MPGRVGELAEVRRLAGTGALQQVLDAQLVLEVVPVEKGVPKEGEVKRDSALRALALTCLIFALHLAVPILGPEAIVVLR